MAAYVKGKSAYSKVRIPGSPRRGFAAVAAVEGRTDRKDELSHRSTTIPIAVHRATLIRFGRTKGDPDHLDELGDGDMSVVVAVARARRERHRR